MLGYGLATLLLAGCGAAPGTDTAAAAAGDAQQPTLPGADAPAAAAAQPVAGAIVDRDGKPVAVLPFDVASIPTSQAALGAMPFFGLPQDGIAPSAAWLVGMLAKIGRAHV